MKLGAISQLMIAGAVGAGVVIVGQGVPLQFKPVGMDYKDWAGILLGAAALLVTVLGVIIAVAAIWGFSAIKSGAEIAAVNHVADQLVDGTKLSKKLDGAFDKFIDRRFREEWFYEFLQTRVDEVLFGGRPMRHETDSDDQAETDAPVDEALGEPATDPDEGEVQ